jgi:hypothetical protein
MGAATGDVVTGYFSSPEHGGWKVVFYILAGWAFGGSFVTALIWNATARGIGVLPSVFPKLAAIASIVIASVALAWADQSKVLQIATYFAAVCLLGAFTTRWASVPALFVAAAGLVAVFASYVRMSDGVTWDQATGMVAFGLTVITSLMILVEKKGESCGSS